MLKGKNSNAQNMCGSSMCRYRWPCQRLQAHPLLLLAERMMHALIPLVSLQERLPPARRIRATLSQCTCSRQPYCEIVRAGSPVPHMKAVCYLSAPHIG